MDPWIFLLECLSKQLCPLSCVSDALAPGGMRVARPIQAICSRAAQHRLFSRTGVCDNLKQGHLARF